jgi:hypothetical protein
MTCEVWLAAGLCNYRDLVGLLYLTQTWGMQERTSDFLFLDAAEDAALYSFHHGFVFI